MNLYYWRMIISLDAAREIQKPSVQEDHRITYTLITKLWRLMRVVEFKIGSPMIFKRQ